MATSIISYSPKLRAQPHPHVSAKISMSHVNPFAISLALHPLSDCSDLLNQMLDDARLDA